MFCAQSDNSEAYECCLKPNALSIARPKIVVFKYFSWPQRSMKVTMREDWSTSVCHCWARDALPPAKRPGATSRGGWAENDENAICLPSAFSMPSESAVRDLQSEHLKIQSSGERLKRGGKPAWSFRRTP